MDNNEKLRFPVGKFEETDKYNKMDYKEAVNILRELPAKLNKIAESLTDEKMETKYRQGGWTIRQVINHIADSHINSYTRFKLALTEDNPSIKPYDEVKWAELPDGTGSIVPSLKIIEGVHERLTRLLDTLDNNDLARTIFHPEHKKQITVEELARTYAWHSEHHLAHIEIALAG